MTCGILVSRLLMANAAEVLRARVKEAIGHDRGAQAAFAEAVKLSPAWVSQFLSGKRNPPLKRLDAIAAFCRTDPAGLFAGSDLARHTGDVQQRTEAAADVAASARVLKQRESSYAQALDEIHRRSAEILVLVERVRPDTKARTTAHPAARRRGGR